MKLHNHALFGGGLGGNLLPKRTKGTSLGGSTSFEP